MEIILFIVVFLVVASKKENSKPRRYQRFGDPGTAHLWRNNRSGRRVKV